MAKFVYSMQSLLNIKVKLEDQQKIAFSMARARLDTELEKMEELQRRQGEYRLEAKKLREDKLDFGKLKENQEAQEMMTYFISQQQKCVQKAEEELEKERLKLQEMTMDRKMHEKLREKAFADYMLEENRRESKEVDELTSYVYGQRAIHNA